MITEAPVEKAKPSQIREYFGCTTAELLELKKADPKGYENLAIGIGNGSYTY